MRAKSKKPTPNPGIRERAESRIVTRPGHPRTRVASPQGPSPPDRLIHELQVHQVELELQNTELREVRDRMERLLQKFTELYDFAPVGYFSLDPLGRILEVNLTGSVLLNVDRSRLIGTRLVRFIAPLSPPVFPVFMDRLVSGAEKPTCEIILLKSGGRPFWANCHGAMAVGVEESHKVYRVAVSDITAFKEAEDARRRLEAVTRSNRELKEEIVRRQAVEASLKASERNTNKLLRDSQRMQEMLRHLSHGVLHAQEEERKRISRELHDQITQTLVGIHVQLESLSREANIPPAKLRQRIAQTQHSVEASVRIVREFARELRPSVLDDLGLIASLKSFFKEFTERSGVRVRFSTFAGVDQLKSDRRIVLYRVAQSALTNVFEHAKASQVSIDIQQEGDSIRMQITDDGRSFNVHQVLTDRHSKRLGILGMRERLEMVGGSLAITSHPGEGTTLLALLPFHRTTRSHSPPPP
jgi:signal transduction histidine kinase